MTINNLLLSFYASAPFDEFERVLEETEDAEFIESVEE